MSEKPNSTRMSIWLGLAAFAWSMLFVWQGLDFTDMGYWLTGYQQLYTHPDTVWALCWLSSFIGHWIGLALGGGVLAYRLGYVMLVTASAIVAYRLLAFQFGYSRILAAMVLLTVCSSRVFGGNWVGYNELTALFYLTGAALLFFGLVGNRKLLVVLAGVVLGANTFIRFPNVLGITLVAAVWLQAWVCRWSLRDVLGSSSWFLGGFLLGVSLIWGLIVLNGHEAIYCQSITEMFGETGSANSPHSGRTLLKLLVRDHVRAFAQGLCVVVIGGWIANWVSKQRVLLASVVVFAGTLLLSYVTYVRGLNYWQWCIPGTCYIVLLSIVLFEARRDRSPALLAFMGGMVLFLAPLGSNNGIANSVYGMWLALPLTLIWLWRSASRHFQVWFKVISDGFESKGKFSMGARGFRVFVIAIVLALLSKSLASAWRHTYLDSKDRLAMTHSIAHPLLVGTYTTAERAKVVTELLDAMSRFARPGDEVLAYNGIPLVYFLTETHPWLEVSWPDFEGAESIVALIGQKEQTGAELPCIVRATGSTYANSWPIAAQPLATWSRQDEPRRAFAEFEQRHGYVVAWSNEFFEILTTDH
jgi:hypothetical protein